MKKFILILAFILMSSLIYSASYKVITVKQGQNIQTISQIYLKNANSWRSLLRYNGLKSPSQVKPGMKLKIPYSLSSERIATIIFKTGDVKINGINAKVGSLVKTGYQVSTGTNGRATIKLDDGSKIKIERNSVLVLNKYGFKNRGRSSNVQLKKGGMLVKVNKLTRRNRFGVSSITATAGVRGTTFHAKVGTKQKDVKIAVYAGSVNLKQKGKDGKSVNLSKGQAIQVKKGKDISKSKKSNIPKKLKWIKQ